MALIYHLPLDDNAASTTVVATVGTNGTLEGGDNTSVKQTGAGPGGTITWGFDFNGTDDAISITSTDFANSTAFSFSAWVKPDNLTAKTIAGRLATAFRGVQILNSTTIRVDPSGTGNVDFTVPAMSTGAWYHLFVTRTAGNSLRVFLNGVESSSGAQTGTGNWTIDRIGRRAGSTFFDGVITQVRVWNTDESANVATWYAEGVGAGFIDNTQTIISLLA